MHTIVLNDNECTLIGDIVVIKILYVQKICMDGSQMFVIVIVIVIIFCEPGKLKNAIL